MRVVSLTTVLAALACCCGTYAQSTPEVAPNASPDFPVNGGEQLVVVYNTMVGSVEWLLVAALGRKARTCILQIGHFFINAIPKAGAQRT